MNNHGRIGCNKRFMIPAEATLSRPSAEQVPRRRPISMAARVRVSTNPSRQKEPIYPIFLKLSLLAAKEDSFWKSFFETMAAGRLLRTIVIRENCICFKGRRKSAILELTPDILDDWNTVADFFRTNCDTLSKRDCELRKERGEAIVKLTSAQLAQKSKRDYLNAIPDFVLKMKKLHKLSASEMGDLESLLITSYNSAKQRARGDIEYGSNGVIKNIKTLMFDEENHRFFLTQHMAGGKDVGAANISKEIYVDTVEYLTAPPLTKISEKKTGLDDEIRKYLEGLYGMDTKSKNSNSRGRKKKMKGDIDKNEDADFVATKSGKLKDESKMEDIHSIDDLGELSDVDI